MSHPEHLPGERIQLNLLQQMGLVYRDNASRVAWHSHEGFEILFLLEGATSYEFKSGKTVELHGGEFFIVPPKAVHRGKHDVRSPCRICGLALSPEAPLPWRNSTLTDADAARINQSFDHASMTVHPLNSSLRWIIKRLMDETDTFWSTANNVSSHALLRTLICAAILEAASQILSPQEEPQAIVAAAIKYLSENYQRPIQISDLAKHLGYSRSRTFELFKSQTGLTPNDYLQRVRTQKAQDMLLHSRQPITEIAFSVGFNSSQYFSTVFRRYTGHTPAEFRQASAPSEHNLGSKTCFGRSR